MAAHMLFLLVVFHVVSGNENYRNDGLLDHINSGMKFAQNLLGSESVALKVADFVVRAFQTVNNSPPINKRRPSQGSYADSLENEENKRRPSEGGYADSLENEDHLNEERRPDYNLHEVPTASPWRYLVRLLGLQPNQISAVAVNALVFVAQMITTFLAGPKRPSKPYRSGDPTDWILSKNSKKLQELIATAKNESLPEIIEELIKQNDNKEETNCIRLLVCKITPFISKMQKAVFGKENKTDFEKEIQGAAIMYHHLPNKREIKHQSDVCEKRFKDCDLNE